MLAFACFFLTIYAKCETKCIVKGISMYIFEQVHHNRALIKFYAKAFSFERQNVIHGVNPSGDTSNDIVRRSTLNLGRHLGAVYIEYDYCDYQYDCFTKI